MRRSHRSPLLLNLAVAGLVASLAPLALAAQEPQRTHTVRPGDTLWDLAQTYLGDPFRWPEIYRRNTEIVKDPHWIYPDQVLIISGDVAPTPGTPADTIAVGDPMAQPVYVQKPMTIFNPERFRVVRGDRQSLSLRTREEAVRAGDYLRAPFLTAVGGLTGVGVVDATTSADGVGITLSDRPIQIYDRVHVQLPAGAQGVRDERFLTFVYGATIPGKGRVVIPTGLIRLTSAAVSGRAEAILTGKYSDVYKGHHVMLLDTITPRPGEFPTRVEFGTRTSLIWMDDEPVLPGIGQHMIFAAGSGDGLVPGDQITLQRDMGNDSRGVPLPPEDIAVAQVTRVTQWGASAIVLATVDAGTVTGMAARVTAKMP